MPEVAFRASPLTPRAKIFLPLALLVLIALSARQLLPGRNAPPVEFTGATMGTTFTVKIAAPTMPPEREAEARDAVERVLARVDALMSTYDSTSEISRFNDHLDTSPFRVSAETLDVIAVAQRVADASGGAFDVTVGPLVDAWGFGVDTVPATVPDALTLARLGERVGYFRIFVDASTMSVAKADPHLRVDLSAVAKGFGVDLAAEALDDLGVTSYLIEVGGELRGRGRKPDGTAWTVGIEYPDPARRAVYRVIELVDEAVATSGDYRNVAEIEGDRYSHIIDPRTGRPVTHAGTSVTVLHERAAVADAWATALGVLGPEEGLTVASNRGLRAIFMVRGENGIVPVSTPAFDERYGAAAAASE